MVLGWKREGACWGMRLGMNRRWAVRACFEGGMVLGMGTCAWGILAVEKVSGRMAITVGLGAHRWCGVGCR